MSTPVTNGEGSMPDDVEPGEWVDEGGFMVLHSDPQADYPTAS